MPKFQIFDRPIGPGHPVYIIAEMSANHGQKLDEAMRLVEAAKDAGADAIKLQTYTPDTMTINSAKPPFQIGKGTIWEGKNLYELYQEAYTPWQWHGQIMQKAQSLGMDCFSSPFDPSSVDFLETLNVPAYKIASFELVDIPLLQKVAMTRKPVILSTGMGTLAEIDEAVRTLRSQGTTELALLKCTSAYPSTPDQMNLRTLEHLAQAFNVPVGLSDHSMMLAVPVCAVAMGACIIEKHLTLSRQVQGPDSAFSLEPDQFTAMVQAVRTAEDAIGTVSYQLSERDQASRVFRKSLFVVEPVKAGESLTSQHIRCIRPGDGLHPRYLKQVLGKKAKVDIETGTPLAWELF